jgi:hypothetical protein
MSAKQKPKTEPHIRHPVELLKSPAMWVLSRAAHKILMYVECQGAKFAGKKNGKVPITYESLEAQGLHTNSIPPALNEIHALGVGEVRRGRGGNAEFRRPNFIRVTYLSSGENREIPPTHEWKAINTLKEAEEIAKKARAKKSKTTPGKRSVLRPRKVRVKHPSFRPRKVRDTDPNFHPQKVRAFTSNAISHSRPAASEPVRASEIKTETVAAVAPAAAVTARKAELATKAEQDLLLMVTMLRKLLGNKATNTVWNNEMLTYGKGWSPRSFCRRLRTLRARGWVRIVGDGANAPDRVKAAEGSLYEATDKAPDDSHAAVADACHDSPVAPATMNGAADAAAKAAREPVQRLNNKGKPPNAA